jgi:hypothetical protein
MQSAQPETAAIPKTSSQLVKEMRYPPGQPDQIEQAYYTVVTRTMAECRKRNITKPYANEVLHTVTTSRFSPIPVEEVATLLAIDDTEWRTLQDSISSSSVAAAALQEDKPFLSTGAVMFFRDELLNLPETQRRAMLIAAVDNEIADKRMAIDLELVQGLSSPFATRRTERMKQLEGYRNAILLPSAPKPPQELLSTA